MVWCGVGFEERRGVSTGMGLAAGALALCWDRVLFCRAKDGGTGKSEARRIRGIAHGSVSGLNNVCTNNAQRPIYLPQHSLAKSRLAPLRQTDLEDQHLIVQIEPTLIRIRQLPTIHVAILGNEVVV
jgi:hypothetical protein